ncbi:MAG: hypothetical protein FD149_2672 [Rhodospirillaceae bacterium]|nr:MAG: hypothetical protein FD149_2672 [Rhodospirillaceae bacterium]
MDDILSTGPRIATWLHKTYPDGARAKRVARDFNVALPTAERWLGGARPAGEVFDAMVARWGPEVHRLGLPAARLGGRNTDALRSGRHL